MLYFLNIRIYTVSTNLLGLETRQKIENFNFVDFLMFTANKFSCCLSNLVEDLNTKHSCRFMQIVVRMIEEPAVEKLGDNFPLQCSTG